MFNYIHNIFYPVEILLLTMFRNSNIFVHQLLKFLLIIFNIFVYVYNSLHYYKKIGNTDKYY